MRRILAAVLILGLLAIPARGAQAEKYVALTFDDGPSGQFTRTLLDGLRQRQVKATFLLCGYRMAEDPVLTARICREGHEVGYHGYTHDSMAAMSRREIAKELADSQALLPPDCQPVFLRPPGGSLGDGLRQVAEVRQLAVLLWSVDPRDWETGDSSLVVRRVLEQVEDGSVILLHDMSRSSVSAALKIIDALHADGFTF